MSHAAYVRAAYAMSVLVLGGLGLWIIADMRARRRELSELEARGVRRRSDKG